MTASAPSTGRQPARPVVLCRYLDEQQHDLLRPWFVMLDLTTGALSVGPISREEARQEPPWAVAATWTLRWPTAPLPTDHANKLLDELTQHANRLLENTTTTVTSQHRPATVLHHGAGLALDAIARRCAATWTDPDTLRPDGT